MMYKWNYKKIVRWNDGTMAGNAYKLLEMAEMAGNSWIWLEMAGKGWKRPE